MIDQVLSPVNLPADRHAELRGSRHATRSIEPVVVVANQPRRDHPRACRIAARRDVSVGRHRHT
eukprot:12699365-Alexandrium_andersonii.AAC.1